MSEISKEDFDRLVDCVEQLTKAIVMLVDSQRMTSNPTFIYTQPGSRFTPTFYPATCGGASTGSKNGTPT